MNIFESLENLNVSEECFEDIVGLVEEYINEMNIFTVGKVNALRRKNADDARLQLSPSSPDFEIKNASKAAEKLHKNETLSRKYVGNRTRGQKTIDDVHNFTKKTSDKLLKSGGDTNVLDSDTAKAVKEFKAAEDRWAKSNPNRKKTGLVFSKKEKSRHAYNYPGPEYKTVGLNLDPVK